MASISLEVARDADAARIAGMSRWLIEHGLKWSWTPERVARHVRCGDSVVLVAREEYQLKGFAIMYFADTSAHLSLLAVMPRCQRRGIGQRLVRWLEESALVAGTFSVSLEVRARNWPARRFYRHLGYADTGVARLYYGGCEDAIRMSRDLRVCRSANMC